MLNTSEDANLNTDELNTHLCRSNEGKKNGKPTS